MAAFARGAHAAPCGRARPAAACVHRPVWQQRDVGNPRGRRDSEDGIREASLHGVARWGSGAMNPETVGIYHVAGMEAYSALRAPFNQDAPYQELAATGEVDPTNFVFPEFRRFMRLLGWDASRYGTPEWNPLGCLVQPGQTVLLKPNLVVSEHPAGDAMIRYTDTDGALVRCVAEYVAKALGGRGSIVIGGSPVKETDFAKAAAVTGIAAVGDQGDRFRQGSGGDRHRGRC